MKNILNKLPRRTKAVLAKASSMMTFTIWRFRLKRLGSGTRFNGRPVAYFTQRIEIGRDCVLNHACLLDGRGGITIGDRVHISPQAMIETGQLELAPDRRHLHQSAPIVIEDGAWIASGAIILAGVTVGRSSVVAAGAVVTKSVPPNSLAKGVPATFSPLPG